MKSNFVPSLLVLVASLVLATSAQAKDQSISIPAEKGGSEILALLKQAQPALKPVKPTNTIRTGTVRCSSGFDFSGDQCTFFGLPSEPSRLEGDAATTLQDKINDAKATAYPGAMMYETQVKDLECDETGNCEFTIGLSGGAI